MTDETSDTATAQSIDRPRPEPWKQEQTLVQLYHEQGLSQYDIADKFDVTQPTIGYWMNELDVDTRQSASELDSGDVWGGECDGYRQYLVPDVDGTASVYEHQLTALLDHSIEEVFGDGQVVHHWLDSQVAVDLPANLELMSASNHMKLHQQGYSADVPTAQVLAELYDGDGRYDAIEMSDRKAQKLRKWDKRLRSH